MEILRTERLTKYFGHFAALQGVTLRVFEGEKKSLIGPNGAGKTTLFNLISGLLNPNDGWIFFRGANITGLPSYKLCTMGIARSFQLTNIFAELSVFENVRLAAQAKFRAFWNIWKPVGSFASINEEALDVLNHVELYSKRKMLAKELSYGDVKHLEIAIALATGPNLLMLDEPTAGMSPDEKRSTIKLIEKLAQGLTIFLIEHDMGLVMSISDSIAVLNQGFLIADGSPDEIRANEGVKEAYLGET